MQDYRHYLLVLALVLLSYRLYDKPYESFFKTNKILWYNGYDPCFAFEGTWVIAMMQPAILSDVLGGFE
jgi:hypothetical protein